MYASLRILPIMPKMYYYLILNIPDYASSGGGGTLKPGISTQQLSLAFRKFLSKPLDGRPEHI